MVLRIFAAHDDGALMLQNRQQGSGGRGGQPQHTAEIAPLYKTQIVAGVLVYILGLHEENFKMVFVGSLLDAVDDAGVEGIDKIRHQHQNHPEGRFRPGNGRGIFKLPDGLQNLLPGGRRDVAGIVQKAGHRGDGNAGLLGNLNQGGLRIHKKHLLSVLSV